VRKQWSAIVGVAAVVVVLIVVAVVAVVARERMEAAELRECRDRMQDYSRQVNTDRWFSPEDLIDLGAYTEIHWQMRTEGQCADGFSSVAQVYQGVVRLRPEDAKVAAKRITDTPEPTESPDVSESTPAAPAPSSLAPDGAVPPEIWPDLLPFVPRGVTWVHNQNYDDAQGLQRGRSLYVDAERSVAFFEITEG
jgi:hypothetical protein